MGIFTSGKEKILMNFDRKIYGYDFEVFSKIKSGAWFCVTFIDYYNRDNIIFIENDRQALIDFYNANKESILVGYNSRFYDSVIFKAILAGMDFGKVNDELIQLNKREYQILKNHTRKKYPIYNYDLIQKDKSLKQLEGFMGYSIKESNVPFDKEDDMTPEDIAETKSYNIHDVQMALKVLDNTMDDFTAQFDIINMYGLSMDMFNKTKVQLASNILGAVNQHTLNDEFSIKFPPVLKLKDENKHVLRWFENPKNWSYKEPLHSFDDQHNNNYEFTIAGVKHILGYGGIHGSNDEEKIYEGIILALDVSSQYPNIDIIFDLLSRKIKNPEDYEKMVKFRLQLKAALDARNKSLKPMINGVYGATKDRNNPMYDPNMANLTCIFAQTLIIDLIEKVAPYSKLLQSNTDGIYVLVKDEEMKQKVLEVAEEWQKRTKLELEIDEYRKLIQKDVNNYIMIDANGKYKSKGAYVKKLSPIDYDLPIVNKAIVEYFVHDIPVEDTINNCDKLIDFQQIVKLGSKYKEVLYGNSYKVKINNKDKTMVKDGEVLKEKVHRIFASARDTDKGIYKSKIEKGEKSYEKISNTPERCFIYNDDVREASIPEYLDRQYYIDMANKRINAFLTKEEEKVDDTPNILYECMCNANNYYEFLENCINSGITKKILEEYIKADCCSCYGKTQKLLDFKKYFDILYGRNKMNCSTVDKKISDNNVKEIIVKYSELSKTGKTYANLDSKQALLDIFDYLPNEHIGIFEILEAQINKFNECYYKDETLEEDVYFVLNVRDVISPNINVYNIKTGQYEYLKLDKQIYNVIPLGDGDIFTITKKELEYEQKIVGKDDKGINILEDDLTRGFYRTKNWKILYRHYNKKKTLFSEEKETVYE